MANSRAGSAFNRTLRDTVSRFRLAPFALTLYEGLMRANPVVAVSNLRYRSNTDSGGLPLPPAHLRFLVAGTADIDWFLQGGALGAKVVKEVAPRIGAGAGEGAAMLDFGCGCGRVIRHWRGATKARVFGTDYNPALIDWCQRNLLFAEFSVNQRTPPLSYADGQFDLIYAFSVFTHLTEDLQMAWMRELTRVLRPRGVVLLSTHGVSYANRLTEAERRRFDAGELVVKNDVSAPGTNACAAYHPHAYVTSRLAGELELVDFRSEGAVGNPHQDLYVLRKPASRPA